MTVSKYTTVLRLTLSLVFFFLLQPTLPAFSQGIVSIALSHNINWMPESDAFPAFRSETSSEVSSMASLGSEVVLGYEMFFSGLPGDSVHVTSLQLQAGYLQRGYRVALTSGSQCFNDEGYNARSTSLRLALLGRRHLPLGKSTSLVLQLGASYGQLLSADDNVAEIQFCDVPTESVEAVMPASFFEVGGGVGVQRRIGPRLVGNVDLVFFMPVVVAESETRPSTGQIRSLLVDVSTPNVAITLGAGWVF